MAEPIKRDAHPTSNLVSTQLKDIQKTLPLRVLSKADWAFWQKNGYVIVRQAVPAANVERLVELLWRFDEKNPSDASTWYAPQRRDHIMKELNGTGRVKTQPADRDPMHPDMTGLKTVNIDMEPGDLMIFNSLLAHGVRPNHSDTRVRMAQYISMFPANEEDLVDRTERIRLWRELDSPKRDAFPGDPRDWEKNNATTAKLSPLGEKLLGLKSWR